MGGGGDAATSSSNPSQKEQPRQLHSWQWASLCELEQTPGRQVRYGASPRMPELHGSLVEMAQSVQPLHLHKWHELLPVHEGSHSSHFVSCARPEEQARKPWQKSQSLHLHVSQCVPFRLSLQCAWQARWSMSLVLNGTHVPPGSELVATRPRSSPLAAFGVPSGLQKEHPRHLHVGQTPCASAGSHVDAQLITSRSPGMPESHVAEHMWQLLHLQSLQ